MLLHSCMCRTEATRIVAHMCHGALRPFHTLALVEERADSLSLLGARLQGEGVTLIALAPLLALLAAPRLGPET